MNLNHIKTSLYCKFCSGAKSGGDALNLFDGQIGDIGTYLLIEQGTQFFHGKSFGEHTGDISDHSFKVGIGLMQLRTDFTSLRMNHIGQGPVIIKSLFGVEGRTEAGRKHRNIPNDNHSTSSTGDLFEKLQLFCLGKSQRGRSKDDAIF